MSRSATVSNEQDIDEQKQQLVLNQLQQLQQLSTNVIQKKLGDQQYAFQYLGIPSITRQNIMDTFGSIRFVMIMGPESRAKKIAVTCVKKLNASKQYQKIGDSEFFSIYKVGCVLCCSHGMGLSSVALFMNELFRIMNIAKNNEFELVRLGSSGGIGMEGGTLVVSTHSLDPITLKPEWCYYSCGHQIKQECIYNSKIYKRLYAIAKAKKYKVDYGKTVSTETYYESQGRLDGSLCQYTETNKMEYLRRLHKNGVRNFEMEGTVIAGICTRNDIKCGMIAVSYLDRLKEDTVPAKWSAEERNSWMENAIDVLLQYIYQFVLKK